MNIRTVQEIDLFKAIVSNCHGPVWMQDAHGREYNLKSKLGMYQAIGVMLSDSDNDLELYAADRNSEFRLIQFLRAQAKRSA